MTHTPKPAALKTDESGNCISICRTGQLEYIHKLINEDGFTQREACQTFIDAVNEHVNSGDPITSALTVGKVRSQFRRDSGKLKDKPKSRVGSTQPLNDDEILTLADEIREQRHFTEFIRRLAKELLEEKCLAGCDIDPELCSIRKFIIFIDN